MTEVQRLGRLLADGSGMLQCWTSTIMWLSMMLFRFWIACTLQWTLQLLGSKPTVVAASV